MTAALTVVVPFHELAGTVPATLRTLASGADEHTHFVLLDDGSRDDTAQRLVEGAAGLPRSSVVVSETNLGPSAIRNLGLRQVDTELVTFLDGDDFVSPGWFGHLRQAHQRLGVDMLRTDHVEVRGRQRLLRRVPDGHRDGRVGVPRRSILPADRSTAVDHPNLWAGSYHRRLLDAGLLDLPEDLRTAEDRVWTWRLFLAAESFSVPSGAGVHYRRDVAASATATADERQLDFFVAMDRIVAMVQAEPAAADPGPDELLVKALRRYGELLLRHLGMLDRFEPGLRREFLASAGRSLRALPQPAWDRALAGMGPERRQRLQRVVRGKVT